MSVALDDFDRDRDRRDPQRAARLFEVLWPDSTVRVACGHRLAQSIRHAHGQADASWEVTMFADYIRLNVGQVEVLKLSSDEIVVLFRAPFKTRADERFSVDLDPANPVYRAVPVASGVCRFAPADLRAAPRTLWTAHESFIDAAADAKKVSPFKKSFSDGVLRHVETLLGGALPRPSYLAAPDDWRSHTETSISSTGAGFGDPEENRKVEQAAVRIVSEWYRKEGWQVKSVEAQRCGFDLLCERDGTEVHVEVKGAAGSERRFIVTAGELRHASDDDRCILALVTDALTEHPNLEHWSAPSFRNEFDFEPIQYWATARGKKATASPNHGMQPTRKKTRG
jgi:Protein NO VEIN, C-terminal